MGSFVLKKKPSKSFKKTEKAQFPFTCTIVQCSYKMVSMKKKKLSIHNSNKFVQKLQFA